MWSFIRAKRGLLGFLAVIALMSVQANADNLSKAKIAALSAQLQSDQPESFRLALIKLERVDRVPDELIGDVLLLYIKLAKLSESQSAPTGDPDEIKAQIRVLMQNVLLFGSMDSLWGKMNAGALADALRPYFQNEKQRGLIMEIPSHNEKAASILLPELTSALAGADDDSFYWYALALEKVRPPAKTAVPVLLVKLSSANEKVRENASRALVAIGVTDKGAVPTLIKGASDPDIIVSENCAALLSKIGYDPSTQIQPLLNGLNKEFNFSAVDALVKAGPKVIGPVRDHAATVPFDVLDTHLMVLRSFKSAAAKALAEDLKSENANLRYLAVDLAAEFPDADQKGPDWLRPYLADPDKNVRILALKEWVHRQTDVAQRIALLQKDIVNPDLQSTAIDLAAEQKDASKPLLVEIQAAIEQADDKTKINYLADECTIDPSNQEPYKILLDYLHNPNEELVKAALDILIYDDALRSRSASVVKQVHDDPVTSSSVRREIDSQQNAVKIMDQDDQK
jgi:HEAT repeat protein